MFFSRLQSNSNNTATTTTQYNPFQTAPLTPVNNTATSSAPPQQQPIATSNMSCSSSSSATTTTTTTTATSFPVKVFLTIKNTPHHTHNKCANSKKAATKKTTPPQEPKKEIRRFRTNSNTSLDELKKELIRIANLQSRSLNIVSLRYRDEDSDLITCDSEEEWKEALHCCSSTGVCVLEVDVQQQQQASATEEKFDNTGDATDKKKSSPTTKPQQQQQQQQQVYHRGVVCDGCNVSGIPGTRYKCAQCSDFDLCETCFSARHVLNHGHHLFLPITRPIPIHTNLITHLVFDDHIPAAAAHHQKKETEKQETEQEHPPKEELVKQEEKVDPVVEKEEQQVQPPSETQQQQGVDEEEVKPQQCQDKEQPVVQQQEQVPVQETSSPVTTPTTPQQVAPIDPAHAKSLEILQQMGFDNREMALFLIKKYNNNIQKVVDEYLKRVHN